jgi:3-oxoacyl-[acyl-carrier-protein] synthase II
VLKNKTRVVITGMGTVNPLGLTVEESWTNLIAGKSGIGPITLFDASSLAVHIAGELKGFDPANYMDAKEARRRDRYIQMAVAATRLALDQSGLKITDDNSHEIGCYYGTAVGGLKTFHDTTLILHESGPRRMPPFAIPNTICDGASSAISIDWGIHGLNFSPVTACSSGSDAIGLAYQLIQLGQAQVVVAGGSEAPVMIVGIAAFDRLGAMSHHNEQPEQASRPFDKHRDGLVMGEGAATLIVEELEFALRRGAAPLAEIIGYGATSDAFHLTAPAENGVGAARAMQAALKNAGLQPDEIDWISAHATATSLNDKYESMAIKSVYGDDAYKVPISGTKSMTGHMMGATGALEVIFGVKAIHTGCIPPTINYTTPDPDCDLDYVPNTARPLTVNTFMSNAFGFGGHNSVLIVKRFEA